MPDIVRRYVDAALAVAIMGMLGIISGFVVAGLTGDRSAAFLAAIAAFAIAGVVLLVRAWRLTRRPALPSDPAA